MMMALRYLLNNATMLAPPPLQTTHEDHNEVRENSPKKIPDLCACVVGKK